MNRNHVRAVACAGAVGLLAVFAAACGSSEDIAAGTKQVKFGLTDAGCEPHDATVPAGPISFEIEDTGSTAVTEMEIMDGEEVLGEQENLTEGLSGGFSLTLDAGKYKVYCPHGDEERGTLTVTDKSKTKGSAEGDAAVAKYRGYLEENTEELVAKTKPFVGDRRGGTRLRDHPPQKRLWWLA